MPICNRVIAIFPLCYPSQIFNPIVCTNGVYMVNAGFGFGVRNECLCDYTVNPFQNTVNSHHQITLTVSSQLTQPRLAHSLPIQTNNPAIPRYLVTWILFTINNGCTPKIFLVHKLYYSTYYIYNKNHLKMFEKRTNPIGEMGSER